MTQALALRSLLRRAGHRVTGVLMGQSAQREVPAFFLEKIDAPVTCFESPNFVADARHRSVRMLATCWYNAGRLGRFQESLRVIDAAFQEHRPHVVVNFFEPLTGLYDRRRRPAVPMVCIGHQYMFEHPAYTFPPGHAVRRRALRLFTRPTAGPRARKLALSLYPAPDLPEHNLAVMPPLLREEVFALPHVAQASQTQEQEPFVLIYLLNSGYADEVIRWHEAHPAVRLHCFWDRAGAPPVLRHDAALTFHRIDDEKFMALMARCRGLVCTAGFESVGEAMYLGKPVQMVPVEGHFEQRCNALDGVRAGAGIRSTGFEVDRLAAHLPRYRKPGPTFRRWVESAGRRFLREIEAAAGYERAPQPAPRELVAA